MSPEPITWPPSVEDVELLRDADPNAFRLLVEILEAERMPPGPDTAP